MARISEGNFDDTWGRDEVNLIDDIELNKGWIA
jgi:hypothetical protein